MVQYLEYNGKQIPVKVGYYAIKHTSNEYKTQNSGKEMGLENLLAGDITVLEPLLFYSIKLGHMLEKTEMQITREDIEIILDLHFAEFIQMLNNAFPTMEKMKGVAETNDTPKQHNTKQIG